jgi:hypothetical protein
MEKAIFDLLFKDYQKPINKARGREIILNDE